MLLWHLETLESLTTKMAKAFVERKKGENFNHLRSYKKKGKNVDEHSKFCFQPLWSPKWNWPDILILKRRENFLWPFFEFAFVCVMQMRIFLKIESQCIICFYNHSLISEYFIDMKYAKSSWINVCQITISAKNSNFFINFGLWHPFWNSFLKPNFRHFCSF